jgi:hypothetical protein
LEEIAEKKVGYKVNKFLEGHLGKSVIEEEVLLTRYPT